MEPLRIDEIVAATAGTIVQQGTHTVCRSLCTDTRAIRHGDTFVALHGDRFDAHNFIPQAIDSGAQMIVVSRNVAVPPDVSVVKVDDTLRALGDIAAYYRKKLGITVIAITGSNGKTTTKEMLAALLSTSFKTAKTEGTKNNLIGVPLTIFSADATHNMLVLELGINQFGEMDRLGEIASPDMALFTGIAPSHLEFFHDTDGVFRAKSELFAHVKPESTVFINKNDAYCEQFIQKATGRVVTFGCGIDADYSAQNVRIGTAQVAFELTYEHKAVASINIPLTGVHNVGNFVSAAAVAHKLGVSFERIQQAARNINMPAMRMETVMTHPYTVINDAYNANPASTRIAFEQLCAMPVSGKRIIVFADMKELGKMAEEYHREMGRLAASLPVQVFISVGSLARCAAEEINENNMRIFAVNTVAEAADLLVRLADKGDLVLLKGSRSNRLEQCLDVMRAAQIS